MDLSLQNPWWSNDKACWHDHHLEKIEGQPFYLQRPILEKMSFNPNAFHIVRGARQVGKTTLVKQWVRRCINEGWSEPQDTLYLSCEAIESFRTLHDLLVAWLRARKGHACVFLDEVSFVEEWQRAILGVINLGLLANASLIVTGSNARDLRRSSERFPGRRGGGLDIDIHPFSPDQLLQLPAFRELTSQEVAVLYLQIGGFPHALRDYLMFGEVTDETYRTYMNWIIGDAARFSLHTEALQHIMRRIAETSPNRITWSSLIQHSPVKSRETAISYIEHLEDAFLCKVHLCYDEGSHGPAIHKARKLFFVDPLLYHLADGWKLGATNFWDLAKNRVATPEISGGMLEAAYVTCLARMSEPIYFWYSTKAKREIDIVFPQRNPIELFDCKLNGEDSYRALGKKVEILGLNDLIPFLTKERQKI